LLVHRSYKTNALQMEKDLADHGKGSGVILMRVEELDRWYHDIVIFDTMLEASFNRQS